MPNSVTNWVIGLGSLGASTQQSSPPIIPPTVPSVPQSTVSLMSLEVGKANYTPLEIGQLIGAAVYSNPPTTTANIAQANYSTIPQSSLIGNPSYTPIQSPLGTFPHFTTPTSVWYGIGNSSGTLPISYPGQAIPSPEIGKIS